MEKNIPNKIILILAGLITMQVFLLSCESPSNDEGAEPELSFYPLRKGNYWIYTEESVQHPHLNKDVRLEIIDAVETDNGTEYVLNTYAADTSIKPFLYYLILKFRNDGLYQNYIITPFDTMETREPVLKTVSDSADFWYSNRYYVTRNPDNSIIKDNDRLQKKTYLGDGFKIEIPLGKFTCKKYMEEMVRVSPDPGSFSVSAQNANHISETAGLSGLSAVRYKYYADGIGMILTEIYTVDGELVESLVLKSYKLN